MKRLLWRFAGGGRMFVPFRQRCRTVGHRDLFSKPNIADIFKPVVGSGAAYEQQSTDQKRPAPNWR